MLPPEFPSHAELLKWKIQLGALTGSILAAGDLDELLDV
jgi:hypothetical protein